MTQLDFNKRLNQINSEHNLLINRVNEKYQKCNGVYNRYRYPVLTADHAPLFWRYDLNYNTNPFLMERLGINCVFNAGAIEFNDKICLIARVEGVDRKSFFAVAESKTGIDNFKFRDHPVIMPETDKPDINIYDMRLVQHQDGWIYGIFCTERKDPDSPIGDTSSAIANCGIARTKDLVKWERLNDIISKSSQQRNVVLHPEFINGKYAFYTRPQDAFISAGGGIGWGLSDSIENAEIEEEIIIDGKEYHTIKESKNGQGAAPIKTDKGWLNIAHGVRNTAAGLRYVLYSFLTDLDNPEKIIYKPGGYFMAPQGDERVGDVSNVLFINGIVARKNNEVFIYYASSDTRVHVATSTIDQLLDYVINTPQDAGRSFACVEQRNKLIDMNLEYINSSEDELLKQIIK